MDSLGCRCALSMAAHIRALLDTARAHAHHVLLKANVSCVYEFIVHMN
jgi:hypothetical protein